MADMSLMQPWLDYQKKVVDSWQAAFAPSVPANEKKGANMLAEGLRPFHDAMKQWVDIAGNVYAQSVKQMGDSYPIYQQTLDKMAGATSFQQGLTRFWEDLNTCMSGRDCDPAKFLARWNDSYGLLLGNQFLTNLPDEVKNLYGKGMDVYHLSTATSNDFFKPWLEKAQNMQSLLLKSMTGDQNAYIDFARQWQDSFSSSFGKVFNIPQFSLNRDQMQKQLGSVSALITFTNSLNEYMATMLKTSRETMEEIVVEYRTQLTEGTNPKTFKEFYEYWWRKNEAAYLKLFGTAEFAKVMDQLMESGVKFKKNYDDMLEKQLEFLPFPSKTDMDSVYRTLDTLKREVRALKREVAALQADDDDERED